MSLLGIPILSLLIFFPLLGATLLIFIDKEKLEKEKPIAYQTGTNGRFGFNLKGVKIGHNKRQILRNLVNPKLGLYIFNCAFRDKQEVLRWEGKVRK